jgi:recombination protein U
MALRGNELEKAANKANISYRKADEALILKVPTGITITKHGAIPQKSTVDFVGILKGGKFIAYDAKETKSKTSFPLKNIHQHQYEYLKYANKLGGVAFFLIHFTTLYESKAFIVPMDLIIRYWERETRKSIPITEFKKEWLVEINEYLKDIL